MPFYRKPRNVVPLSYIAEKKSIKNGVHHSIFTPRFDMYRGDWNNDEKQGKGAFLTANGRLYEGDWFEGFRHGFGTLSFRLPSGSFSLEYRGDWVRGKPEGVGWRYYQNVDVYFGHWMKGHQHGYGKMWYGDGTMYVGYWNKDKRHGLGMFVQEWEIRFFYFPYVVDGNRYEGNWSDGMKHGLGRFYHMHTGQLQEGCWVKNICIKSKMTDIIIRQMCELPTDYPIPSVELQDSLSLLEASQFWMRLKLGDIDKKLKYCIDKMDLIELIESS